LRVPPHIPANRIRSDGRPRRIGCYNLSFIDSGLWCWDTTTQVASDHAPSPRRGWWQVLSFSFPVRACQRRVTLPCKSLPGVRAPNNAPDHRVLLARKTGSRLPHPWLQPRPSSKNRLHLPLNPVPNWLLFLLGPDGLAPLLLISQQLRGETYLDPPPGQSFPQLKPRCGDLVLEECQSRASDLTRYHYRPSLKPHPFMRPNKFDEG